MSEDNEAFLERQNEMILERVLERLKSEPVPPTPTPVAPSVEPQEPDMVEAKWCLTGLGIAAFVAAVVRFPLKR